MTRTSADGTAALDKALDVLDAVGQSPRGLTQPELASKLALPRTTLYRLLGTLVARGLLRRDPQRRLYCLGFRCFEYARSAYAMPDLVAAAAMELRAVRDMTGETTYLAALDGLESVVLERCEGAHGQRSRAALGQRRPLNCTSYGKAMLAAMDAPARDALVKELPLATVTSRSITDRRRLQAELRLTATRGFSIDDEEIVIGVRCCGAAIVDAEGRLRGAISVAGPAYRLTMERLALIGPEVAEAARRIGAQLAPQRAARGDDEPLLVAGDWAFDGAFPHWLAGRRRLVWADRLGPALHSADAQEDRLLAQLDAPIDAALPHGGGIAFHCGQRWLLSDGEGEVRPLAAWPQHRPSAVTTHPDGRVTMCLPDGDRWRVVTLASGRLSEGLGALGEGGWRLPEAASALAWDGEGSRLVIAAGDSGTLYEARPGAAGPSNGLRRLATVPKGSGRLSGLALDAEGGIWSALRGGWSVTRFEPDGSMDRVFALPVPCPSDLAFGGDDGRTLFVTSARGSLGREELEAAPLSGRLFAIDGGVSGVIPAAAH